MLSEGESLLGIGGGDERATIYPLSCVPKAVDVDEVASGQRLVCSLNTPLPAYAILRCTSA